MFRFADVVICSHIPETVVSIGTNGRIRTFSYKIYSQYIAFVEKYEKREWIDGARIMLMNVLESAVQASAMSRPKRDGEFRSLNGYT